MDKIKSSIYIIELGGITYRHEENAQVQNPSLYLCSAKSDTGIIYIDNNMLMGNNIRHCSRKAKKKHSIYPGLKRNNTNFNTNKKYYGLTIQQKNI